MAQVVHICNRCKREGIALVSEGISSIKGYVWGMSFSCAYCGSRVEAQGGRPAPPDVRDALISQDGKWALRVTTAGAPRMKAVRALRSALSLSIEDAAKLKASMPGRVAEGTRGEMEYLEWVLSQEEIGASVEQS